MATPQPVLTSARTTNDGSVSVSGDIAHACHVAFDSVSRAPKFNFDETSLEPQDISVIQQIATCVTSGPLKGRSLKLTGRADISLQ